MHKSVISIITPTYNPTELICQTYDSLLIQDYKNFEWIIIDDGSTKKSKKLILNILKENKIDVKLIQNEVNKGVSFCRNLEVKNAQGDFIMFLDDDDLYPKEHLTKMVDVFECNANIRKERENTIVYCQTKSFINDKKHAISFDPPYNSFSDFKGLDALSAFMNSPFFNHTGMLIPIKLFFLVDGYNEELKTDEDGNLIMKLMMKNCNFILEETTFYLYRQHTQRNRLSYNESSENVKNRLMAMEFLIKDLEKLHLKEKYAYEIAMRLDHIALAVCSRNNKPLAQKILAMAESILPHYLSKRKTVKTLLRRILGCSNYDRFLRIYGFFLRKIMEIKK